MVLFPDFGWAFRKEIAALLSGAVAGPLSITLWHWATIYCGLFCLVRVTPDQLVMVTESFQRIASKV